MRAMDLLLKRWSSAPTFSPRRSGLCLLAALLLSSGALAADGDPDPGFGAGIVVTDVAGVTPGESANNRARSVVRQADGKLVVAGYSGRYEPGDDQFALVRYNTDGSRDTSFNGNGIVTTDITAVGDGVRSIIQQADRKLVAAGYSAGRIALARYNPDGSLDASFGGTGIVITDTGAGRDEAHSLIQQADGKLVVAGFSHNGSDYDITLARYQDDGSPDPDFGVGGLVVTDLGSGDDGAFSVIQQADRKLVVAGYSGNSGGGQDIALVRYNVDGSPDDDFGTGGTLITDVSSGNDQARSVIQSADGKLVVAGSTGNSGFALIRYLADGSPDRSFGTDGATTSEIGPAESVIQQSDGKLVVAGHRRGNIIDDFALSRYNADGSPDTGFGVGGVATTALGSSDQAYSVIQQEHGKLVVAGQSDSNSPYDSATNDNFALARYNADGSLDSGFGTTGVVTTLLGPTAELDSLIPTAGAHSVVQQTDDKLVVAGYSHSDTSSQAAFSLARYNPDGSLDRSFADGGIARNNVGVDAEAKSMIRQADGKLVLAGNSDSSGTGSQVITLVRHNADGSRDDDFGIVRTNLGSNSHAESLIQQANGKLVAAGHSSNGGSDQIALVRYNLDGSPDTAFDGDGVVTTDLGPGSDRAHSLVQQENGKLVVAGDSHSGGNTDFALVRYNTDGGLDDSFGEGGIATIDLGGGQDQAWSVIQQADKKLVVAGFSHNGSNTDFALVRYHPDGSPDGSFGDDGVVLTDLGSNDRAFSLIQQADGKLVIAGDSDNGGTRDFALVRYNSDGRVDTSFGTEGTALIDAGSDEIARSLLQQSDGFLLVAGHSGIHSGPGRFIVARIHNGIPTADPGGPYTVDEGRSPELDASASSDADGTIVSYDWDLDGDGQYDDASGVTTNPGIQPDDATLTIGLRVTDNDGKTGTATTTVQVANVAPVADTQSVTVAEGADAAITLTGTDVPADTLTFALQSEPTKGSLWGTPPYVVYTPFPGAIGADSFTFDTTDDDGGNSPPATVSIEISDITPPEITLNGAAEITLAIGNSYTEPGATVSDNVDSGLEPSISGSVDTNSLGSYQLTYSASDISGNTATPVTRAVYVVTPGDTDSDGLPDDFETEHSLDPSNPDDAEQDLDGDGRSNLEEYLAGSDPTVDDVPPVVTAPDDIETGSTGPLTPVELGTAIAVDFKDGDLTPGVDNPGPFAPGAHTLTWSATDAAGNSASVRQQVSVLPMVQIAAEQSVAEGADTALEVTLNGEAIQYPVTIPYSVSGTASSADHTLDNGEIAIESGTAASLAIETLADSEYEGVETLDITLGEPTNAVPGNNASHRISLLEENAAPRAGIMMTQSDESRTTVTADGEQVQLLADIDDPNPMDQHRGDWGNTDSELVPEEGHNTLSFTFAPGELSERLYPIELQVSDDGSPVLDGGAQSLLRVIAQGPELSDATDSDGDGLSDAEEGLADWDMDRIPDYLDPLADSHLLPAGSAGGLIQTETGLHLRLGTTAFAAANPHAEVTPAQIEALGGPSGGPATESGDDPMAYYAGIFDFEIVGLQPGASARVVIPQKLPLLGNSEYRKYLGNVGWFAFMEDANNQMTSAPGVPGICPAPGNESYTPGLTAGHHCIQLTVRDGGPNDADGVANGSIADPGGAAVDTSIVPQITLQKTRGEDMEVKAGSGETIALGFVIHSDSDDAELHSLTFTGSGSGDDASDISEVSLYLDQNQDGEAQAEELIGTASYSEDNGDITISLPETHHLPIGESHILVGYQFQEIKP